MYEWVLVSSPMVGVLSEVLELREEELSALARGAVGRGPELVAIEGLNGRAFSMK